VLLMLLEPAQRKNFQSQAKTSGLEQQVLVSSIKFWSRAKGSGLEQKVLFSSSKFWSRAESSGLVRTVPSFGGKFQVMLLWYLSWKIPLQAACGTATCRLWPGILGNHFCQVEEWTESTENAVF
jgi:hypothetical protein